MSKSMTHPSVPLFRNPRTLETRIVSDGVSFQGEYKTVFGNWRWLTGVYRNKFMAEAAVREIKRGLPAWTEV